ncbi:hypothetical protein X801_01226 [Opisthorchis viverrini]|uniref:Tyrosine-protein phosphatase domain-containing protein n=1 Tax=Opisthorchis viverrini TaxID=6198 RepID=A0A1S8X854_OPIVI|nr:hypothetical protein X801_01226 [Opisthorchis viverrini]
MVDPPPAQLRNAVISSMHVPVEDMEGANLRAHFDRVGDRIASEQRRGGRTLVHCMAGPPSRIDEAGPYILHF